MNTQGEAGTIRLTVLADGGLLEPAPRQVTLAATNVLSVHDDAPSERSLSPASRCRIVLVEEAAPRAPWVFSDENDDASPPHRELLVAESRRTVDLLVQWALAQPRTYSADDVKEWDDWVAAGKPLDKDLIVGPPAKIVRRPRPSRSESE
jgi:hypothetical protein